MKIMKRDLSFLARKALPPLLLALFITMRYKAMLGNFWLGDDTQILKLSIERHPWEYFFLPKVWQAFSASNLTPWLILSFDFDRTMFGLDPGGFYLHHLLSLCLLAGVAYTLLRLWFPSGPAFFAVLLFAASPPFAASAQSLMVRHYIEGFLFALLSILFFVKAVRANTARLAFVAAFFYLLSCSAKEIYLPLVFLIVFLPEGIRRISLRFSLPYMAVAIFYVFWRWFMLGRLTGGYGLQLSWPLDAGLFFPRLVDAMGGAHGGALSWWGWLIGAGSLTAAAGLFLHNRKRLLFFCLIFLVTLVPIVPVSPIMSSRYVWLFSFCWSLLQVAAWDRNWNERPLFLSSAAVFLGAAVFAGFFIASEAVLNQARNTSYQQGKEGRFVLEKGSDTDLLLKPASPGWYYEGLSWLRKQVLRAPEGPAVLADTRLLCLDDRIRNDYGQVWYFDLAKRDLVSESVQVFGDRICTRAFLKTVREDVPLSLTLEYRDSLAAWKFGPYQDGTYELLFGRTAEDVYPLTSQGSRPAYVRDSLIHLRLRYTSPEGWLTYSPLLDLKISSDKGSVAWSR